MKNYSFRKQFLVLLILLIAGLPVMAADKADSEEQTESMAKGKNPKQQESLPPSWIMAGSDPKDYEAGLDKTVFHSGTKSAFITQAAAKPSGFGTLMQMFSAKNYLDKRLRMSLWVKVENVEDWASPWMRVDGQKGQSSLSFDNMCDRKLKDTLDWKKYIIVLDVPAESTNIAFGVMLAGKGKVWIDDVSFEKVSTDVPTTDCPCYGHKRKTEPQNLNFEQE